MGVSALLADSKNKIERIRRFFATMRYIK